MNDMSSHPSEGSRSPRVGLFGAFAVLALLWALDFYLDVRVRDAFTWMDPYQYFTYAYDFVYENRGFNTFELPSIFPFFIALPLSISETVAGALSVNLLFFVILLVGIHALCAQHNIRAYSPLVAIAVLSSPLLMGLSRSLYIEFSLSAMMTIQYASLVETRSFTRKSWNLVFACLLACGFMMKMTYPVYLAAPFAVEVLIAVIRKEWMRLATILAVFVIPIVAVLGIEYTVFPKAFGYYLSLGNTRIPIMRLIGPTGILSLDAVSYYFVNVWKTMLFLLTPLLLIPVWLARRRDGVPAQPGQGLLWLWFLAPLVLFTLQEVKEPRHAAPCVVPAVLLLFTSLPRIRHAAGRMGLATVIALLSLAQYGLVATHHKTTPYFRDRPTLIAEVLRTLQEHDPRWEPFTGKHGSADLIRWLYTKNIAMSGFNPNHALAYAWFLNPAVVIDLDLLEEGTQQGQWTRVGSFEDIFFLNAFNLYNRRCLWPHYYRTLDRNAVLNHAEYILDGEQPPEELARRYPQHQLIRSLSSGLTSIHILRAKTPPTETYRSLFDTMKLSDQPRTPSELATIYYDLSMDALLRGDVERYRELKEESAARIGIHAQRRNIYWTANERKLQKVADLIRSQLPADNE